MSQKSKQQITDFFKKTKRSVANVQGNITESAMIDLFQSSPHIDGPDSRFSESEYDANHKVQINQGLISPHIPATRSEGASAAANFMESQKAEQINSGDRVEIFNTTAHNEEVEVGGPTWRRLGYYPYTNAMKMLERKFSNVTK